MNSIQAELTRLATENAALRAICGVLIAEIAILHPSPPDKMGEIIAKLQGLAHASGEPAVTQSVERIAQQAERALVLRRPEGD